MINVGVIGYGYWGPNLVRNLAEVSRVKLTAVADSSPEKLALVQRRFPAVTTTADYQDLIRDPSIDAIAVATPVSTHFELGMAVLKALDEAAKKTGLMGLIASHPLGLDLPIQEGGRGLSGGQRSLVGLTRLLMANPRIWLLDEPTANLDSERGKQVVESLIKEVKDRDLLGIMVTHDLSMAALSDRVLILRDGALSEEAKGEDAPDKV